MTSDPKIMLLKITDPKGIFGEIETLKWTSGNYLLTTKLNEWTVPLRTPNIQIYSIIGLPTPLSCAPTLKHKITKLIIMRWQWNETQSHPLPFSSSYPPFLWSNYYVFTGLMLRILNPIPHLQKYNSKYYTN